MMWKGLQIAEPALLHWLREQHPLPSAICCMTPVFEDHVVCLDVGEAGLVLGAEQHAVLGPQSGPGTDTEFGGGFIPVVIHELVELLDARS